MVIKVLVKVVTSVKVTKVTGVVVTSVKVTKVTVTFIINLAFNNQNLHKEKVLALLGNMNFNLSN